MTQHPVLNEVYKSLSVPNSLNPVPCAIQIALNASSPNFKATVAYFDDFDFIVGDLRFIIVIDGDGRRFRGHHGSSFFVVAPADRFSRYNRDIPLIDAREWGVDHPFLWPTVELRSVTSVTTCIRSMRVRYIG